MAARDGETPEAREALATLCETYWYPLYAFVRRKGLAPEAAEDVVQGFFGRLLEKRALASVDGRKGKFRSFLLASCSNYLLNLADHDLARKRGGGRKVVSIDGLRGESRYLREAAHSLTAERLFDRQWALTLLDRVLARLEAEMQAAGKSQLFDSLRPALLGNADRAPFAAIGERLGISEQAARTSATRLRRRYREILREEVASTIEDPDEVDEEINALFVALSG